MDCSPPGPSVHGTSQAGVLEWVAIPFSKGSSWPRDQTWFSCTAGRFFTVCNTKYIQNLPIIFQHPPAYSSKQRGRKVDKRSSANRVSWGDHRNGERLRGEELNMSFCHSDWLGSQIFNSLSSLRTFFPLGKFRTEERWCYSQEFLSEKELHLGESIFLGEALRCLVWQHYSVQTLGCNWILEGEKKQTEGQDRSQPALTAPSDIFSLTQSSVHSPKKKAGWGRKEGKNHHKSRNDCLGLPGGASGKENTY